MTTAAQLVQTCNAVDYDAATGGCAAPYYAEAPSFVPLLSAGDGFQIAFAIVGCWTVGLVGRLIIRAGQAGEKH